MNPSDFVQSILVDMGGDDEFGENFPKERVLGEKQPINFFLDHPTFIEYLDPVFYAHNLCAYLLKNKDIETPGFHIFPKYLDKNIAKKWMKLHHRP